MENELKFEVGEIYENMKGPFEVVSIHRNAMVIRWDNGCEIATTVEFQKRILERMAFDKKARQEAMKAPKKPSKPERKPASPQQ